MKRVKRIKQKVREIMLRIYLTLTAIATDMGLIRVQNEDNAGLALDIVLIFIVVVFAIIVLVRLGYDFNDIKSVIYKFFGV